MPKAADRTNDHYAPLFSRFKADVGEGAVQFETDCLAYELRQLPGIPDEALVLDAGCGTGRYAAAWRALHPAATVIGVDINRVILRSGQVRPGALAPINGNLEALPFASGSFDVVMSRGVIQHTPHPEVALRELLRVCKPGGTLFFYTYRHGWYDVVLGGARTIAKGIGAPLCSRVIYGGSRLLRLDPRAPTMILDELFVPIRFAFSEDTVRGWLARSGVPIASIRPIRHAQFGNLQLPVNRRTRFLHRVLPKNGVIALGVQTAPRAR
jgi:SAM-dependent methyltransferase